LVYEFLHCKKTKQKHATKNYMYITATRTSTVSCASLIPNADEPQQGVTEVVQHSPVHVTTDSVDSTHK